MLGVQRLMLLAQDAANKRDKGDFSNALDDAY